MFGFFGPFVIPAALATADDLAAWTGKPSPDIAFELLRACTALVLEATESAYYDVDETTGLATDPDTLAAMRDATCIQAAAWAALNIDPATGGVLVSNVKKSKRIGSAAFDLADAGDAATARATAYTTLVPAAVKRLQRLNLLGGGPWPFG